MFQLFMPNSIKAALADSEFRVHAVQPKASDEAAELLIMDSIGDDGWGGGIPASKVVDFVRANRGRPLNVRINSFGGSVYDGFTILNSLKSHDAPVTTVVEGIAYSAASIIAMAGTTRLMHETSDFGIHRALVGVMGNANMMRAVTEWLETIDGHQVNLFASRTGKSDEQINAWLDGSDSGAFGTVFPAAEALEQGFITAVIPLDEDAEPPAAKILRSRAGQMALEARRIAARVDKIKAGR